MTTWCCRGGPIIWPIRSSGEGLHAHAGIYLVPEQGCIRTEILNLRSFIYRMPECIVSRSFLNVNHSIGRTHSWRTDAHFILPVNILGRLRGVREKPGQTIAHTHTSCGYEDCFCATSDDQQFVFAHNGFVCWSSVGVGRDALVHA